MGTCDAIRRVHEWSRKTSKQPHIQLVTSRDSLALPAFLRCGMGLPQGRMCGLTVVDLIDINSTHKHNSAKEKRINAGFRCMPREDTAPDPTATR